MTPGVFLDRDGVLLRLVQRQNGLTAAWTDTEAVCIPEARALVQAAQELGAQIVVVTNQPDVADGTLSLAELDSIHRRVRSFFGIENIEFCPSRDNQDPRRKPNPGMILDAAQRYRIDLRRSVLIGDSAKDIEAGSRAGVSTILLRTEHNRHIQAAATAVCESYDQAALKIRALLGAD